MKDFQQQKKKGSFFTSKLFVLIIFVLVLLMIKSTWDVFQKEIESQKNAARAYQELSDLTKRKEQLESQTHKLDTGQGIEAAIREKFQVVKEGESVIVFVNPTSTAPIDENKQNIFQKMWSSASGLFKRK